MERVDGLKVARIGDGGDLYALSHRAAYGVAGVLVEAGQQGFVVGQLHQAGLPHLQRAGLVAQPAEQLGRV